MKTKSHTIFILILLVASRLLSQSVYSPTVPVLTPDGCFDMVFDANGNKYSLYNLQTPPSNQNYFLPAITIDAGYFRLFISSTTIFTNSAAANVLKQVCQDISGLIVAHAPLNAASNSADINIFVTTENDPAKLASFSSFFSFPLNPTNPNQGYIDGLIHKYLTTGIDPYSNLPITFTNTSANNSLANFYHGILFINNTPNLPPLFANWNFALNTFAPNGQYDLYSTLLHEITHGLGFQSLIRLQNQSAISIFGPQNQYYSRYDQYLFDISGAKLITSTSSCGNYDSNCSSNYTAIANSSVLSTNSNQTTNCLSTANYSSSLININVYTPSQFVNSSSLSHFNDRCPTPSASLTIFSCGLSPTDGNDNFFLMTSKSNLGGCGSKRFLQDAEYYALCDQGYNLSSSYGPSNSSVVISGTSSIRPYNVSCGSNNSIFGVNDGITNGVFTYTTSGSSYTIPISVLVSNDVGNGLFINCVDVIYTNNINNAQVSVIGNSVIVNANTGSGLVIIKYLPTDGTFVGLATYAYFYFTPNGCNPTNNCNMVQNGGFENITGVNLCGPINNQTGPMANCWLSHSNFPSIATSSCGYGVSYNLGVNTIGSNLQPVNSFNGNGNNHALVLRMIPAFQNYNEVIKSTLSGPLISGGVYNIRLNVQNPVSNNNAFNNQNTPLVLTIASAPDIFVTNSGIYPGNLNVLTSFTIPASNSWSVSQITFTFNSPGQIPHNAIFIGIDQISSTNFQPPNSLTCYIDEINIVPSPNANFTLQNTICANTPFIDLSLMTSQPSTGTFSGQGVSFDNGTYNFNFNQNLPSGTYFVAYTYSNSGCTNTIYEPISVSTNTNLFSLNSASLCSPPYTVNLTSLITNSNYINGASFYINSIASSSIATLQPNAIYTLSAFQTNSGSNLCNQYHSALIHVASYPQTFQLTPNNSPTICPSQTLNISCVTGSNSNCSWSPSLSIGCSGVVAFTASGVYTVSTYDFPACPYTGTIGVSVFNINSTSLCVSSGTFDLNQLLTIPAYSASVNYSINGQATSSTFSFNTPGIYTVSFSSTVCNSPISNTIEVIAIPSSPVVTPLNSTVCVGSLVTLTISTTPQPSGFIITPLNYSGFGQIASNTYSFLTNTNGTYSVYTQNGPCISNNSTTFQVTLDPVTCSCTQSCSATLAGTINSSPAPFLSYCVTNDLYINGAVTFSVSEFKISSGVKIHINTGGTLNIVGSHLFACADMWDGILVEGSGALKMLAASNGTTTLIEDAITAVYVYPTTVPHPFAAINGEKIVALEEVTFNRNKTSLKVELFSNPYANNPFRIVNCLFTSRAIPTASMTWPLTSSIKLSSSGNLSPLQNPWINAGTYPSATLKAPYSGQYPSNALYFWAVGHSVSSPGTVSQYTSITVGEGGVNNFNLFDNHINGIYCNRSSITIVKSVFQNPRAFSRPISSDNPIYDQNGGTGVVAVCPWTDDNPARHRIEVIPAVIGNTTYPNYFYDMTKAVVVENYLFTDISRNKIYSYTNNKTWAPSGGWNNCMNVWVCTPPNFGNIGIDITSNSFQYLFCEENELYNIRNGIIFTATEGLTDFTTNGSFGRYIGQVSISRNLHAHNPSTPHGFEYIQQAIELQDPISAPGYTPNIATTPAVTPSIVIQSNYIQDCLNGIEVNSFYGTPVNVVSNSITLVDHFFASNPPQYGISSFQAQDCRIHKNTISGNNTSSQNIQAIYTSMNTQLSIRCNSTENTHVGFSFNSAQTVTHFEDNSMQNQTVGLLLANAAILTASTAALGSPSRPTNNRWLGGWGPNDQTPPFKTYTDFNSSAQNGKFYVEYFNPVLDPDGNNGTQQILGTHNYWHSIYVGTITLLPAIPQDGGPTCRIDFDEELCMGCKSVTQNINLNDSLVKKAIEEIASDSLALTSAMSENQYIAKTMGLRTLFTDSTVASGSNLLAGFTTSLQSTSIAQCVAIEKNIAAGNYAAASSINNSFPPIHPIEQHNKSYYDLVQKHYNQSFGTMDSIALDSLSLMCPFKDGSIVYQARALYNKRFNTTRRYIDVCAPILTTKKQKAGEVFNGQLVPNPNDGSFAIHLTNESEAAAELHIYDITGRLVQQQPVPLHTKAIKVDSRLNNGIYIVKLISHEGSQSYKLIVQD